MDEIQAILDGDEREWQSFITQYSGYIRAVVEHTINPHGAKIEADDAVQEIFIRLIENDHRLLRSYDPTRSSLKTWLAVIARSRTIDLLRRKHLATIPLEEELAANAQPPSSPDVVVELPMELLTGRQKLIMHLLYERELTVREAAQVLDVTEQTIRSARHKALQRLRQHFGEDNEI